MYVYMNGKMHLYVEIKGKVYKHIHTHIYIEYMHATGKI